MKKSDYYWKQTKRIGKEDWQISWAYYHKLNKSKKRLGHIHLPNYLIYDCTDHLKCLNCNTEVPPLIKLIFMMTDEQI